MSQLYDAVGSLISDGDLSIADLGLTPHEEQRLKHQLTARLTDRQAVGYLSIFSFSINNSFFPTTADTVKMAVLSFRSRIDVDRAETVRRGMASLAPSSATGQYRNSAELKEWKRAHQSEVTRHYQEELERSRKQEMHPFQSGSLRPAVSSTMIETCPLRFCN